MRRYPDGKLRIKPSKKNVKTFLDEHPRNIKAALGSSAADLIKELNPKIRGWANYHRHTMNKSTFARVDHEIFSSLWRWARRRHRKRPHAGANRSTLHGTTEGLVLLPEERATTMDSRTDLGFHAPVTQPSSDISK